MRKWSIQSSVWISCLVFLLTFALSPSDIQARGKPGKSKGKGAIKTQLKLRKGTEQPGEAGRGKPVGFAVLNTTAKRSMHIRLHLHRAKPNQDFDVWVKFFPEGVPGPFNIKKFGDLSTNKQGKGNAQYERALPGQPDPDGDHDVETQVVIKHKGVISTSRGMATAAVSTPIKK